MAIRDARSSRSGQAGFVRRALWGAMLAVLAAAACAPPAEPGEVVLAIETAPLTLDPRGAFNADTAHVQQLIFNTLVTKGPSFDFAPELAASWEIAPDHRAHVFRLREGVTFHDGRSLTAEDVVFTFGSMLDGGFAKSANFAALERVDLIDILTVRFVSRRPNPGLLVDLVAVGVLPNGTGEEAASHPVGTGPFRVEAFDRDGDLTLRAYADHFAGRPSAESIRVRVVADPATRAAALETGEVDLAISTHFAPETLDRLSRGESGVRVVDTPGGGVRFVVLNAEFGPLDDARVRQALAHALDRPAIVDALLGGRATLATGPLPPGHWARSDRPGVPFDRDRARALLLEATGGEPLAFDLMVLSTRADVTLAAVLQEAWRAVGVDVRIVEAEPGVFFERLGFGEFGAAVHGFTGGNQFTTIFKGAFHSRSIRTRDRSGGELNYGRYRDGELDALIDAADLARSPEDRVRLYAEVQSKIAEAAPWIFLWHPNNVAVLGPRVATFELNRGGDFYALRTGALLAPE